MSVSGISIRSLRKTYPDGTEAVCGVDLETIHRGQRLG